MKIGIDVSQVVYGTGVSVYTSELVKNLLRLDKRNSYVLFAGVLRQKAKLNEFLFPLKGNFSTKTYPIPPRVADVLWNRFHILPIEKLIGEVEVFHSSDWTAPPTSAFRVTTIHDLAPIRFPKLAHPRIYDAHKARLSWVRKEVERIIVPSNATKEELLRYGFKEDKIRLIPEAPRELFYPRGGEEIKKLRSKHKLFGKFILAVGVGPRKNTQRLIKAFQLVAEREMKLVLIGRPEAKIEDGRGIRILGHVPTEELPVFYSAAEALVYPSLYEGFGLPILEAFSCGCPVVTSNISSMQELVGSAAVLVDPYEVESIVEGVRGALRRKIGLAKKGLAKVKKFSWEKTASATLEVYNEAKK